MLSVAGMDGSLSGEALADEAIEMFHAQDALFAENAGQWDVDDVYFGYNQGGTQIYFTDNSLEFGLSQRELKNGVEGGDIDLVMPGAEEESYDYHSTQFSLSFDDAEATVPVGADMAETVFNYQLGAQSDWVDGVATYKTVVYNGLYDGVDLHTFSRHGQMKYEFHVDPGSDYTQIELSYDGIEGLSIAGDGSLHVATELGEIVDKDLYIYQVINGQEVKVIGQFVLLDNDSYAFSITGEYDANVELVIDPNLDWGSYLGGSSADYANDVAVDSSGDVYVCGYAYSDELQWDLSGGWQESHGGGDRDAYLVKLSSDGAHLWSTYLGGSHEEIGYGVAVDSSDNVYVCGNTSSSDWSISGGWDTSFGGGTYYDGFLVKLAGTNGAHIWSTYLGGSKEDTGYGVAVDGSDDVYVCGNAGADAWGISNGWDDSHGGGLYDGYLIKLSGTDGAHLWSTYLGGSSNDYGRGVTVDGSDDVYICGYTGSTGWGISGGWDGSLGGSSDGYLVKFSGTDGTHLWSTYLGGDSGTEVAIAADVVMDASGDVYVCGDTTSTDWVLSGGWDTSHAAVYDGFLVKLAGTDGAHIWSTYLGGSGMFGDHANDVVVDGSGSIYVTGHTASTELQWNLSGGWDTTHGGGNDGYLVKLSSSGAHVWSTYLGGSSNDYAYGIAMHGSANVYITGNTQSTNWGISGGWDDSLEGSDGFVVKAGDLTPGAPVADAGGPYRVDEGSNVTLSAAGSYDDDGSIVSYDWDLDNDGQYDDASGVTADFSRSDDGVYTVGVKVTDNDGLEDTAMATVTVDNVAPTIELTGDDTVDESEEYTLTLGAVTDPGDDTVTQYIVHWDGTNTDTYTSAGAVTHTYSEPDTHTIIVDLVDEDGTHTGAGSHEVTVNAVIPPDADFNADGDVDGGDFLAWQRGFGLQTPNATKSDGDADDDLDVDGEDLTVWGSQFGSMASAVTSAIIPAVASSLESETTALTVEPLSAELVDAAIAMDQTLRPKSWARLRLHATPREDHFDWFSHRARWSQTPAWRGTGEIADHPFRGQPNKGNEGRFYRNDDDRVVDEELLDELFAEGGLMELL